MKSLRDLKGSLKPRKIVKELKDCVMIEEADGTVAKYCRAKEGNPKPKKVKSIPSKQKPRSQQNAAKSKQPQLRECRVVLRKLSQAEIAAVLGEQKNCSSNNDAKDETNSLMELFPRKCANSETNLSGVAQTESNICIDGRTIKVDVYFGNNSEEKRTFFISFDVMFSMLTTVLKNDSFDYAHNDLIRRNINKPNVVAISGVQQTFNGDGDIDSLNEMFAAQKITESFSSTVGSSSDEASLSNR